MDRSSGSRAGCPTHRNPKPANLDATSKIRVTPTPMKKAFHTQPSNQSMKPNCPIAKQLPEARFATKPRQWPYLFLALGLNRTWLLSAHHPYDASQRFSCSALNNRSLLPLKTGRKCATLSHGQWRLLRGTAPTSRSFRLSTEAFRTTLRNSYKITRSVQVRRVFDSGAESDIPVGYS